MADLELNSIGNGDGNNYLLRDNTKIPLSGSNQISGDLIPATNDTVNLGSLNNVYNITYSHVFSGGSDTSKYTGIYSGNNHWGDGAAVILYAKECTLDSMSGGEFALAAVNGLGWHRLIGSPNGTLIWEGDVIRPATDNDCELGSDDYRFAEVHCNLFRGSPNSNCVLNYQRGGFVVCRGANVTGQVAGQISLSPWTSDSNYQEMYLSPDGSWWWSGQAVQIGSDARLKQQIKSIDDDLLTAWEDVELVQFKYNDAVDQKGKDKARLHTGYVVQQIDEACKKHNVDISEYGLYCHEVYQEETEEVEVEQEDGTKVKERKVIREASEHYSLRYTETLVVECAYLRRENDKLKQQMLQYAESLSKLEERLKALEQPSK